MEPDVTLISDNKELFPPHSCPLSGTEWREKLLSFKEA
jgi:hypothetical protein